MAEDQKPIIVKRRATKGHAHHGGAWKIAYADFVTAMMAFFLLMWLLASTTKEQKMAIADFFNNPSKPVTNSGGASSSVIQLGGGSDFTRSEGDIPKGSNPPASPKNRVTSKSNQADAGSSGSLEELRAKLAREIETSQMLKPFKDQLALEITKEGLRIQILDQENRPMFANGSAVPEPYVSRILHEIGKIINVVHNRISISDHTDARAYANGNTGYSNWELATERALAVRRELIAPGGMDGNKVLRISGFADTLPLDQANRLNPANRRISILVLNQETEAALADSETSPPPEGNRKADDE